jgi:bifunctional DNA-binding transcriptional regulator/antitoxin component of YhaV-PrlF toxin-antitoxin module
MAEIIVTPKISVGWRIALTKDFCDKMGVEIGDKILIVRRNDGEIVLRKIPVVA